MPTRLKPDDDRDPPATWPEVAITVAQCAAFVATIFLMARCAAGH